MFAFVEGILEYVYTSSAVINCGGVGYEVMIPTGDVSKLPPIGEKVRLHTSFSYNENSGMLLCGFLSKDDLEMFKLLITVNGIGPKGALGVLSSISSDTLRFAILGEDSKTIAKAPGIGKKTAERLIIDLKDKVSLMDAFEKRLENTKETAIADAGLEQAKEDAVMALVALGYSRTESLQAVKKVETDENSTVDTILRDSLKYLV